MKAKNVQEDISTMDVTEIFGNRCICRKKMKLNTMIYTRFLFKLTLLSNVLKRNLPAKFSMEIRKILENSFIASGKNSLS